MGIRDREPLSRRARRPEIVSDRIKLRKLHRTDLFRIPGIGNIKQLHAVSGTVPLLPGSFSCMVTGCGIEDSILNKHAVAESVELDLGQFDGFPGIGDIQKKHAGVSPFAERQNRSGAVCGLRLEGPIERQMPRIFRIGDVEHLDAEHPQRHKEHIAKRIDSGRQFRRVETADLLRTLRIAHIHNPESAVARRNVGISAMHDDLAALPAGQTGQFGDPARVFRMVGDLPDLEFSAARKIEKLSVSAERHSSGAPRKGLNRQHTLFRIQSAGRADYSDHHHHCK